MRLGSSCHSSCVTWDKSPGCLLRTSHGHWTGRLPKSLSMATVCELVLRSCFPPRLLLWPPGPGTLHGWQPFPVALLPVPARVPVAALHIHCTFSRKQPGNKTAVARNKSSCRPSSKQFRLHFRAAACCLVLVNESRFLVPGWGRVRQGARARGSEQKASRRRVLVACDSHQAHIPLASGSWVAAQPPACSGPWLRLC